MTELFVDLRLIKFSFSIFVATISFSTKVAFLAPLEIHSIPKDPDPEYKSRMYEFLILTSIRFECIKILKIFSLTASFKGLVSLFFIKSIDLPFNIPLIILINYLFITFHPMSFR